MKKITLFLVAIFAMVNVANAQRAWAYDLELTPSVDSYTFAFKAVTAGDATLVFYKEGVEAGTLDLGSVSAGDNTVTKTSEELLGAIQQSGNFTWGVKMTGSAIASFVELTKDSNTDFHFWMPTGVAVDNNPESPYFSRFYIASPRSGKMTEGGGSGIQHNAGVYVFDQTLTLLNETKQTGYVPSNVTVSGSDYFELHRIAVNPTNNQVAFSQKTASIAAIWSMNPASMKSAAENLISGTAITDANSCCFDKDGVLYVANTSTNSIYKVKDGVATIFVTTSELAQPRNAIASDGRGGLWIAQYRGIDITNDGTARLMHIDSEGTLDYKVDSETPHGFTGTAQRGAVAYNIKEDILAFGANKYGNLYKVTYDAETGDPSLESIGKTPSIATNIDGLAFDYAGDLYITTASIERLFKYAVPTNNNTCTTPAKKSQVITLVSTTPEYSVTINVNGNGTVTGANTGTYLEGTELTLTATPAEHYEFVNWTDDVTSTDNPLIITVNGDKNITANFAKKQYTLTVSVNDGTKGSVNPTSGTYAAESEVQITAVANPGYEFTNWSNGSKTNPLTISMEEDTELTANFRAILPSSITLNAHPVKDYSASIVGTMKRAIQYGENTIVLTHEDNGTPHIYNIAHTTKTVTEISQEGVNAAADGFLSISDIALTEDGKLVACNYEHCTYTASNTSYFYIWDDIAGNPRVWFTSQKSGNYTDAYMGYTMALKGTSQNSVVTISAFNKNSGTNDVRFSHHTISDGVYVESTTTYKYLKGIANKTNYATVGSRYELNASPLAETNWIIDGENITPMESDNKAASAGNIIITASVDVAILGKKYNGASYLFHNDHHLMIAPYATDDKLAGVKVLGITDGFGSPVQVETNTALVNAIDATTAAATAYVDGDGDLTIYLIADGKVYTFSEKVYTAQTFTVTASAGEGGSVEGGGTYEEGATATLTATANEHYTFTGWSGDVTSTENPLIIAVNGDLNITASFTEDAKSTITVTSIDENMGTVSGSGTYYEGETVTLSAIAKGGYTFVKWNDEETAATRTITVREDDATYTAHFKQATSRAWAYDLTRTENGENYDFTFKTTSAGTATLIFKDKDGNTLDFGPHTVEAITAEEKTITIAKTVFAAATKDIYWEVELAGEAITKMAEITDPTRNIYDFYNMMGVVVDNDPESDNFGKIYIQMALGGTTNGKAQTPGIFIFDQNLNSLNSDPNTGIAPTVPSGYTFGGNRNRFHRLNINPNTSDLVYSYSQSGLPAVFAIDRENMSGEVKNLLAGVSGLSEVTRTAAHCFDAEGTLYVMDIYPYSTTAYAQGWNSMGIIYKIVDGSAIELVRSSKFANESITMTSDGRGGLWVAQNRGNGIDAFYQLVHITGEGTIDWAVDNDTPHDFTGSSIRGALAYDIERQILAQGRNNRVELFNVTYDPSTGVPTVTKFASTPVLQYANIDGLTFDYAGDLYVVNSGTERFYKYVLPTNDNTCTVPAPKSQAIEKEQKYTVTVVASPAEGGSVSGGGEAVAGAQVAVSATANTGYRFVNWTKGSDEVSTDASFSYTVPADDVTLIANFELITYTLITSTNDENKGTVSVDGVCTHGSTVTLTATPKEGYKLLYWSDRSTENPRTITMTKNEAISAYFVKEYTEEPTFKIEKLWENINVPASTGEGFQAVGWDGKIYMQNKAAGKIQVFSNKTDAPVDYATSGIGQKIAVDEAGNMIVCNSTFAAATNNKVLIYPKGSTEGKEVSFTLLQDGRCDFFSASGNIYSPEGGYVYFYCQYTTVINRVKIANGELVSVDVVGNNITAGNSQNHVMVDIFGNLVAHSRSAVINATINVHTNESMSFALIDHKIGTLGGCSFELGGKELWAYHAGATNYSSEWNIYNMTDSKFLSDDDFYAVDKSATTNYAANWLNVQVVDENTAYIYQFCPKKAVAMWKVSINRTDLQEFTVTATANNPAMGTVTGEGTYYEDATVTLTATPYAGYRFVNWTQAGVEVSIDATYTFTVTEDVELVANFAPLPEITYELYGGVWNKYGWTSKKDMYDAFVAEWTTYSSSGQSFCSYETQLGIGNSNQGLPTAILSTQPILEFMAQAKWAWLGQFLDALATAQGKATKPTEAVLQMRYALGNFFGEDNNGASNWIGAVDCSGDKASLSAFAPYWGQTFPMPTQPTEEVVLNAPYKEGYEFDGWYTTSDFSGAAVTTVDENTDGTLYAKWIETIITVTIGEYVDNTTNLAPYVGETVKATVTRNFGANKILTVTLPFDMSASQISNHFGNATVYEFYNVVDAGEELHLQFTRTTSIDAGKPYILQTTSGYDAEDGFTIENVTINTELTQVKIGDLTMVPVLDGGGTLNQSTQYYLSNNALYCAGDYSQSLPGLRAFFTSATSTPIRARVIFDDNGATSIPTVIAPETKAQKIIKDGRLIIIRGEHQYNAQGQMIE